MPAWLQNLLGNVITLNAIQTKIETAQEQNDTVAECYWYGRLFNILLVFDPIDVDDFEDQDMDFNLLMTASNFQSLAARIGLLKQDEASAHVDKPGNLFTNSFYFTNGFVDTAFKETSPNATICEGNATLMWSTAHDL